MVSIGTLVGYLKLEDTLSPALKVAQANVASTAKGLDALGDKMEKAGRAMLPVSAAISLAGAAVFKFGKDFEKTLTQIETLAGGTSEQVVQYKAAIMDLVSEVGKSPQELAEALYFITSSGLAGKDALDALEVSAKASALGLGETKVVADAATSALNAYGKENLTSSEAVRVLVATVREGKGEADAIAGSLGRVIPIASEMGVKFQDLGAFMAATTKIGLSAEEAATALRGALTTISAPTKEQTDAFAQLAERGLLPLGFSLDDVRKKIQQEGLAQGFMQLTEATKGNSEALTAIIGNVRAATGVLGAYGRQGEKTLEVQARMRTDLGEVDKGFEKLSQTVDQKWNTMLAGMQANAVNAFDAVKGNFSSFLDAGISVTKGIDDMIAGFKKLPEPVQTAIFAVLGLGAALGPGLLAAGATMKAFSASLTLVGGALGTPASLGPVVAAGLMLIGQAALVVGTAIASWKLGTAIADIKLFGEEQMSLGESFSFGLLKLQQWTRRLDATDADIENSILAQRNLKTANDETAKSIDGIVSATEGIGFSAAEIATPMEQAKNLTAQWNAEMGALQQQVAALTAEQREAISTGIAMEKNTADIATGLGLTEAAVKAYAAGLNDANQSVDKFLEKQRKSAEETAKLRQELAAITVQQTGTEQDARLAQIDEWFNNEVAAIEGVGEAYDQHYAALSALREAKRQGELSNIQEMNSSSLEALEQAAAKERKTYEDMLSSGLTFSREVLDKQREKILAAEDAVRSYGHAWNEAQDSTAAAASAANDFFDHMGDSVEDTLRRMGKLKEAVTETFTMDIQPLTNKQISAIQGDVDLHGQLTGADPTSALLKKLQQLEELEGTYAPRSAEQYKQMIDDQVLLSQLRMMDLETQAKASVQEVERVQATTTAQRNGGVTSTATASVSGTAHGGSLAGGVVMNNYINGTGEQVARAVEDHMMRTLRAGRQFGTA